MIASDGIEGVHGVREEDEPRLCPCGKGYEGHNPRCAFAKGVRGRTLTRLILRADRRAQRRFRAWLEATQDGADSGIRSALSDLYQEAEHLHEDLIRSRIA